MNAAGLILDELHQHGIAIWPEGDRLRFRPRSAVDAELLERMRDHKLEILGELRMHERIVPILKTRVLYLSPEGIEVTEVEQVDPPGGSRFEKRLVRGAVAIVSAVTTDESRAQAWIRSLQRLTCTTQRVRRS